MTYKIETIKKITENYNIDFSPELWSTMEQKSIILNFPDEQNPHGCRRKCSYCNWKNNPLAQVPVFPDKKKLDEYLEEHLGLVTLSGGGDPLFNFTNIQNWEKLIKLIHKLYDKKYVVRVITREQENFQKLRQVFPFILGSFSIDSFDELPDTDEDEFTEYSIVLNKDLVRELYKTKFECCKGHRIVFREPLQTDYKLPTGTRTFITSNYKKSEFSTEKLCYEAKYLVGDKILTGYDIFK